VYCTLNQRFVYSVSDRQNVDSCGAGPAHTALRELVSQPPNGTLAKLQAGSHANATRRGSCRA
jgi:hypothetical protein